MQAALRDGFELARTQGMEGQPHVVFIVATEGTVIGRLAAHLAATAAVDPRQWRDVLGAFTRAQPFDPHTQELGNFLETGLGHATVKPVVYMLGRYLALRGKIRSTQVALAQQDLQSITGCIHGREY